jgi:hypothetical protein
MEGDDTEYMNETFVLNLEKPVEIVSNPKTTGTPLPALNGIDHIEIENDYDFEFQDQLSKKVRLTGTITRIEEQAGYHRQVSTPVQIRVAKMTVLGD